MLGGGENITKGYLGIDESLNGYPWEVYVAFYSTDENDVLPLGNLKKGKNRGNERISELVSNNSFKYVILPRVEKEILGEYRSKLACISDFLLSFHNQASIKIENMLVDSNVEDRFEDDLYKTHDFFAGFLYKNNNPLNFMPKTITFEPKADVVYPVVNKADRIAYCLKEYHGIKGHEQDKYLEHKLNPDWVGYRKTFDYLGVVKK